MWFFRHKCLPANCSFASSYRKASPCVLRWAFLFPSTEGTLSFAKELSKLGEAAEGWECSIWQTRSAESSLQKQAKALLTGQCIIYWKCYWSLKQHTWVKEYPVIYKSRMQVTFKSVVCYYLSITQMVSIGNHHLHKTQMPAQIQAHLVEGVTALFMLPALALCAGVSSVCLLQYNLNIL